jgi:hypothetical protein
MGFITGGPNEAIVVSGVFHSQPLIVVGGWAFVIPCIQKVQRLPLNVMTLKVSSPHVYTMQGVPLSVTGIAQVYQPHLLIKIGKHTHFRMISAGKIDFDLGRDFDYKYLSSIGGSV